MRSGEIELRKVKGEVNPADLFTKFIGSRDQILQLWELVANTKEDVGSPRRG